MMTKLFYTLPFIEIHTNNTNVKLRLRIPDGYDCVRTLSYLLRVIVTQVRFIVVVA